MGESRARQTALCLECRTALAPGEACDVHAKAKPLDLANPVDRGRAVSAVWGPPGMRMRKVARAGAVGGGAGGLFQSCNGCGDLGSIDGEGAIFFLVIVVAAFAAIAIYWIVKRIVHWVHEYRARPRPAGSAWRPQRAPRTLRGTITSATETLSPLTATPCAAWGVLLTHDRATGGPVMLRNGHTGGLAILVEDGRTITIPAGRIRLDGDADRESAGQHLQHIDPQHSDSDPTAILAHDDAYESRLSIGDTVEITGGLTERFDPNAPASFRESPPTRLELAGIATLMKA